MEREIINQGLEKLEAKNSKLPNGEVMDLYTLKSGVLLYGASLDGDEYMRGPFFYSPGDAILHILNNSFQRDSISFATLNFPANTKSSSAFHFRSSMRLREYRCDYETKFYDARGKKRPNCSDVGVSSFKCHFNQDLPEGNTKVITGRDELVRGVPVDTILTNIVNGSSSRFVARLEALFFCQPGKTFRIEQTYSINTSILWTFYAGLLSKGYNPSKIRSEAFIGKGLQTVLSAILFDQQIPVTIGDVPKNITTAINEGKPLESILKECGGVSLGKRVCSSGIFFERLWKRDVVSIMKYFLVGSFEREDKPLLYPRLFSQTGKRNFVSDCPIWFYAEDLMLEMGRGELAYNWNYNRFLDVNSVIYWILSKLSKPLPKNPYSRVVKPPLIFQTKDYDPQKHASTIVNRISPMEINSINGIMIHDAAREVNIIFSFNSKFDLGFKSQQSVGSEEEIKALYLKVVSVYRRSNDNTSRGDEVQQEILKHISHLNQKLGSYLSINTAGVVDGSIVVINFDQSQKVVDGVPLNWIVLVFISSLIRRMIKLWDFDFFSFL